MIKIADEYNKVGVLVSGGAASAVLLHEVCQDAKLTGKDVVAVTLIMDNNTANESYARKVVIECQKAHEMMIEHVIEKVDSSRTYIDEYETDNFKKITGDLKYGLGIDVYYVGWHGTALDQPEIVNAREGEEFVPKEKPEDVLGTIFPYKDLTNKDIAVKFNTNNLMTSLYPLTWSCEGSEEDSKGFKHHCSKCWSCKERYWAFKKY